MKNAHQRMGTIEYKRASDLIKTNIELRCDRFISEGSEALLASVFGGDAEVGAFAAAVAEGHAFSVIFPDGRSMKTTLGKDAVCYRGALNLPGRKHVVRHLVAVAAKLHASGAAGATFLMNFQQELAWTTLASVLGVPGTPEWADWMLAKLRSEDRIVDLDGIGCQPAAIRCTRPELMQWIEEGVRQNQLPFPERDGPIAWRTFALGLEAPTAEAL